MVNWIGLLNPPPVPKALLMVSRPAAVMVSRVVSPELLMVYPVAVMFLTIETLFSVASRLSASTAIWVIVFLFRMLYLVETWLAAITPYPYAVTFHWPPFSSMSRPISSSLPIQTQPISSRILSW